MAINPDAGRISGAYTGPDLQALRQKRQVALDAKVQDASLAPTAQLSSKEIAEHQGFYNKAVGDVDGVRSGVIGGGIIGGLSPDFLDRLFPDGKSARKVDEATTNHIFDNKDARELRDDYNKTFHEARRERTQAARIADKLGPGEHTLSNGDKVNVSVDEKTGHKTVTTTRPDGTTETVSFDPRKSDSVDITRTRPDGHRETVHQDGTTVSKSESDMFGQTTTKKFSLDEQGRPVRESSGPGNDDYTKTTANGDGSTDVRNLIYHEGCTPVYEDKHEAPGWSFPPLPDPEPHPGPFPPFPQPFPHPHWPFPNPQPEPIPFWRKANPPVLFTQESH